MNSEELKKKKKGATETQWICMTPEKGNVIEDKETAYKTV